jgi:hypothetical protein
MAHRPNDMTRSDQNRVVTWVAAIGLAVLILAGCHPWQQQPDQERLIGRIDQYYNALQAKAYAKSLRFHTDRRKSKPTQTSSLASKLSLKMASYAIQSMRVDGLDARVMMHVAVVGHDNRYDIVMIDHWQFIGDDWFVVDVDPAPGDDTLKGLDKQIWQGGIAW